MRTFTIKSKHFGMIYEAEAEYVPVEGDVLVCADGEIMFSLKDVFIDTLERLGLV